MQLRRVVITGLGALTPLGNTLKDYWEGLVSGRSGAAPITRFDASKFKTRFACEVKGFDPENFFDRKEARKMDPFAQYALVASDEAIKDSGLDLEKVDRDRIGVIWGSGIGGLKTFQDECIGFGKGDGTPRFNPFFIPKMIADSAAGLISMRHVLRGPSYVTVSACASGNNSLIDAFNYIRLGMCRAVVTGGSEAAVHEAGVGGFNALHAMSTRNDDPGTASRPYDKDRDGFVLGEGAAAIILEDLEHAKARGARIYCEVIGGGMSSDAYHITAPHPDGLGAELCMRFALEDAGLEPTGIDYINTHGTSTPIGDPQEVKAIQRIFGDHAYALNISSTKSMTGHLLGGAGAVEGVAAIMAVHTDTVPPTINHFTDDPELDPKLNFTFNTAQKRTVRAAMSNTFGFGGHNTAVIFRKYA
ncbi:MAG TPA: beta-ketoacyl-ACP synthase II [Flavobacteriales bacterium]|jgi:3-oxoacyl-[acyl-carrier-protein] synthase II|nr:beta-ketoacyl-ACP synthase II [Flavobacteriales bacterium]MCC6656120.1 beta-ketoacyl-ACP synthase II [Flavobacteriales bacterium]HMU12496.1 beta-ketoacyl-ACP synthase II [Flavobacteriales bacterium]HNE80913.1 beta-ketoacyl-ACP synthase II [Flavobacteriales bacterium]HNI05229.1 beta-ketoacyl-ACP synthase II [Flavobacteriales bacterium]